MHRPPVQCTPSTGFPHTPLNFAVLNRQPLRGESSREMRRLFPILSVGDQYSALTPWGLAGVATAATLFASTAHAAVSRGGSDLGGQAEDARVLAAIFHGLSMVLSGVGLANSIRLRNTTAAAVSSSLITGGILLQIFEADFRPRTSAIIHLAALGGATILLAVTLSAAKSDDRSHRKRAVRPPYLRVLDSERDPRSKS